MLVAATHGRGMYTLSLRRLYREYRKAHPELAESDATEADDDKEGETPAEGKQDSDGNANDKAGDAGDDNKDASRGSRN